MTDAAEYLPMGRRDEELVGAPVDINERVWFIDYDSYRLVFLGWDTQIFRVGVNDKAEVLMVAVWLRLSGYATQEEIARTFGHSVKSQGRWERRYEKEGLVGLVSRLKSVVVLYVIQIVFTAVYCNIPRKTVVVDGYTVSAYSWAWMTLLFPVVGVAGIVVVDYNPHTIVVVSPDGDAIECNVDMVSDVKWKQIRVNRDPAGVSVRDGDLLHVIF